jgi:hypothetical protein
MRLANSKAIVSFSKRIGLAPQTATPLEGPDLARFAATRDLGSVLQEINSNKIKDK